MAMLPVHLFMSILLLQALRISSIPEEAFFGYPLQAEEDEGYLYMDSRADPSYSSASAFKSSETRRRSTLDKNFARFGRSGPKPEDPVKNLFLDEQDDEGRNPFGRSARSGERSDQFIRFGRGKSDFVRFGRADPYTRNRDFIRFGRSTRSITKNDNKKPVEAHAIKDQPARKKRAAEFYKKSGGSNFVRFGRGGDRNDNFMRFGRMMNANYLQPNNAHLNAIKAENNGTDSVRMLLHELQEQQSHELLLKMLIDALTRAHLQKELQQLQQIEGAHFSANGADDFKEHKEA